MFDPICLLWKDQAISPIFRAAYLSTSNLKKLVVLFPSSKWWSCTRSIWMFTSHYHGWASTSCPLWWFFLSAQLHSAKQLPSTGSVSVLNSGWPVSHQKTGNGRTGPLSQREDYSQVYPCSDVMLEEGIYTAALELQCWLPADSSRIALTWVLLLWLQKHLLLH